MGRKTQVYYASQLAAACHSGNQEALEWTLNWGVDVNEADELNRTGLHWAAREGRVRICERLIELGAEVEVQTADAEETPLHWAARHGAIDVVKLLLKIGAQADILNSSSQSPLHLAVMYGNYEVARELMKHRVKVNQEDVNSRTVLHYAVVQGHLPTIQVVLDKGGEINHVSRGGLTALGLSIIMRSVQIEKGVPEFLLKNGALVNVRCPESGYEPLHYAIWYKQRDVARILLEHGADVQSQAGNGWTALHMAAHHNYINLLNHLLDRGADINARNRNGQTPVDVAVSQRNAEAIELLVSKGASLDASWKGRQHGTVLGAIETGLEEKEKNLKRQHQALARGVQAEDDFEFRVLANEVTEKLYLLEMDKYIDAALISELYSFHEVRKLTEFELMVKLGVSNKEDIEVLSKHFLTKPEITRKTGLSKLNLGTNSFLQVGSPRARPPCSPKPKPPRKPSFLKKAIKRISRRSSSVNSDASEVEKVNTFLPLHSRSFSVAA